MKLDFIHEKAEKINASMIEHFNVTSVQYSLMYKGEIVLSGSSGVFDKKSNKKPDNKAMYGIGSVSKVYSTAAVMLLVDMGLVDIDKPVKDYITDFEMADERYLKITVRHLMNHASGIYGTHFLGSFLFEEASTFTHDNLLKNLKTCNLKYAPGEFSEYCNDGFQLLEILTERVSGLSFTKFMEKHFFEPLGIKNTKTPESLDDKSNMARFYLPFSEEAIPREITNLMGTGGFVASTDDMCRFGEALIGKKILSKKSAEAMAEKEYTKGAFWPDDNEDYNIFAYGLGWDHVHQPPFDKFGITALVKGGDTSQYHAALMCLPEHDMIAAVTSSGGISITNGLLATMLLQEALKEYGIIKEIKSPPPFTAPVKEDMPAYLLSFEGVYAANTRLIDVKIENGEIALPELLPKFVPAQTVNYCGNGQFKNEDGSVIVSFVEKPGGLTFVQGNIGLNFPGIGVAYWKAFAFQRLAKNPISDSVAKAWAARKAKNYFQLNEFPSSPSFLSAPALTNIAKGGLTVDAELGYAYGGCRILDENKAQNVLYFRDVADLRFENVGGQERLFSKDGIYISEDHVTALDDSCTEVKIDSDGYAKFFWAPEKTITVDVPDGAVFAAYNNELEYKHLSSINDKNTVELKKGDLLVFAGSAGTTFKLSW